MLSGSTSRRNELEVSKSSKAVFLEYMIVIQILRPKSVLVYEKMVYFGSKIYLNITIVVKQCCEFVDVKNTAAMEQFQSIR